MAAVLVQPFCPAQAEAAGHVTFVVDQDSDCHDSLPEAPSGPPAKQCCAVAHAQPAVLIASYVPPQLAMNQPPAAGQSPTTFSDYIPSTKLLSASPPALEILRI